MKDFSTCTTKYCSGCSLDPVVPFPPSYPEICAFLNTLQPQSAEEIPLVRGDSRGWRMKAKLAVRGSSIAPQIGLFREGTHEVVDIQNCQANHPSINAATQLLREAMIRQKIEPYDELHNCGDLRYVQLYVSRETKKAQLVLVSREKKEMAALAEDLWSSSSLWHSIWINIQHCPTNQILGSEWHFFRGEPWMWQKMGRGPVAVHPAAFSQANLDLFDRMLEKIEEWVPQNARLCEIYAGVGAISFHLEPCWQSARLVEDNPFAELSFQRTLSSRAFKPMQYTQCDAAGASPFLQEADCIIVDPPRKGLDSVLLLAIQQLHAKTLIYISCSFKSFRRDAVQLLASGWTLEEAALYWLFPGTDHVEIVTKWAK